MTSGRTFEYFAWMSSRYRPLSSVPTFSRSTFVPCLTIWKDAANRRRQNSGTRLSRPLNARTDRLDDATSVVLVDDGRHATLEQLHEVLEGLIPFLLGNCALLTVDLGPERLGLLQDLRIRLVVAPGEPVDLLRLAGRALL